jgi:Toprim domain
MPISNAAEFAPMLARLYIARDRDAAGRMAVGRLHERGSAAGIDVRDLMPVWGDFNEDICRFGTGMLRAHLAEQIAPADVLRFIGRQDSA